MSFPGFVTGVASFAESTSYDSFRDHESTPTSTTSNGWVEASKFTATEAVLDGVYSVQWSMKTTQSKGGRNMGIQISVREGDDADANPWIILNTNAGLQVPSDNASVQYSGFVEATQNAEDVYQVRVEFGQTTNGGTQSLEEVDVVVFRVGDLP